MAIDSMNKVIHAAVRRDFARLQDALGSVADGDQRRAHDLQRAWKQLDAQLHHHHVQEDTILFPVAVQLGADRSLVDALEGEHEAMGRALAAIDEAMVSYAASASGSDASDAAAAVNRGRTVVEQHLAHEEADLEPLMLGYAGAPEWQQAMKQVRQQSPRASGWFLAWIDDGADEEARAFLAATIPAPVRWILGRGFGRGYRRTIAPVWA